MIADKFPVFKTKIEGVTKEFDLSDPKGRREYFDAKAGEEIKIIRDYLEDRTFIVYLLGKKNSGKGTYTKLFMEAVGSGKIAHVSVGDIVRSTDKFFTDGADQSEKKKFLDFLKKNYRGFVPLEKVIKSLESRSTEKLLSTELTLALVKWGISELGRKSLFIDGFPRDLDQVSYSLFFRDLIGYRDDPDMFVFIHLPESVIDERMKYRAVCPTCQTPRNVKLFVTKEVGYDEEKKEFYLMCDNPDCSTRGERMISKEGDEKGIESIRDRITRDERVMEKVSTLEGVPKIFLRNPVPVDKAPENVDDYEITPAYSYERDEETGKVIIKTDPWIIKDDDGTPSYSLLAPPVELSLIKQLANILKRL